MVTLLSSALDEEVTVKPYIPKYVPKHIPKHKGCQRPIRDHDVFDVCTRSITHPNHGRQLYQQIDIGPLIDEACQEVSDHNQLGQQTA